MNLGKVVADYGDVLAKPSDLGLVRDINSLPHLKSEIRAALKAVLAVTTNATMREHLKIAYISLVPSENPIRWIRSGKENRIMIETDGDLLRTSAWIYAGLLSFA
jgi:hypothetical protein